MLGLDPLDDASVQASQSKHLRYLEYEGYRHRHCHSSVAAEVHSLFPPAMVLTVQGGFTLLLPPRPMLLIPVSMCMPLGWKDCS